MGNGLLSRFIDFLGFSDDHANDTEQYNDNTYNSFSNKSNRNKIVSLHNKNKTNDLVVFYPSEFSDVQIIVDNLNSRKPVVVSLENTAADVRRRLLDFMSGAIYALQGQSKKVGEFTFIFTPKGVNINALGKVIKES